MADTSSRRAIATAGVGTMSRVLDITLPRFRSFGKRHGYDVVVGCGESENRSLTWMKVRLLRRLLAAYETVVWIDADVLVVDDSEDFPTLPDGCFQALAEDQVGYDTMANTGVWIVNRCQDADEFLEAVWTSERHVDHALSEQAAVSDLLGYSNVDTWGNGDPSRPPVRLVDKGSRWLDKTLILPAEWNEMRWWEGWQLPQKARMLHFLGTPDVLRRYLMKTATSWDVLHVPRIRRKIMGALYMTDLPRQRREASLSFRRTKPARQRPQGGFKGVQEAHSALAVSKETSAGEQGSMPSAPTEPKAARAQPEERDEKALLTIGSGPLAPVLDASLPRLRRFAEQRGYDLVIGTGDSAGRPPYWAKVLLFQRLLPTYSRLLWVDADVLILKDDLDVPPLPAGTFQALVEHSREHGLVVNTGVWLLQRTRDAEDFLRLVWGSTRRVDHAWPEQAAVMELLGYHVGEGPLGLTRKFSRPSEWLAKTSFLPQDWNEPTWWEFPATTRMLHLMATPNRVRVRIMKILVSSDGSGPGSLRKNVLNAYAFAHALTERAMLRAGRRQQP